MYKEASKIQLRFMTPVGVLSVEQLWQLKESDLANSIRMAKREIKKNDEDDLSFLNEGITTDPQQELRFNILKDVYLTKKKEREELQLAAENKKFNQKILQKIADRKDEELDKLSVDELEKLIK